MIFIYKTRPLRQVVVCGLRMVFGTFAAYFPYFLYLSYSLKIL